MKQTLQTVRVRLMTKLTAATAAGCLLLALTPCLEATKGGNPNPGVLPPNSKPYGLSYAEWASVASQWNVSIPLHSLPSPVADFGPVLIPPLAPNVPGSNYSAFTISVSKSLFLPLCSFVWVNAPGDPGYGEPWDTPFTDPWTGVDYPTYEAWVRAVLASLMDPLASATTCQIDGKPVESLQLYRGQSVLFSAELPADNGFALPDGSVLPAGVYEPCVSDGLYLMLTPLSAGKHTIKTTVNDFVFVYDITVKPGK